ncbi:MAG: oxygenase [Methylobacter sp.]|nr:MAG: oxygenase [Methylobacter sp.]
MPTITINGQTLHCPPQTSVLDILLNAGIAISYACKKGTCHSCLLKSLDIAPPPGSQTGLKDTQKAQGYFLACQCRPDEDMVVQVPSHQDIYVDVAIAGKKMLNSQILELTLGFEQPFDFKAGQFVNLQRGDGLTRSYSIANPPRPDNTIQLHIRRLAGGKFSNWLHNEVQIGEKISVSKPQGTCYYLPDRPQQSLLMVATGSGLAPLAGILTDALAQGHTGPAYLFHGSREAEGLYLVEAMRELAAAYPNVNYFPCISGGTENPQYCSGRANDIAIATLSNLKNWRVYICGHPEMVSQFKKQAFLKGASLADIYTDPFLLSPS